MKAKVNLKEFQVALDKIKKVVPKDTSIKILENCCMEVKGKELIISGTSLENTIIVNILAEVEEEGKSLLHMNTFGSINKMKDTFVEITDTEIKGIKRSITYEDKNKSTWEEYPEINRYFETFAFETTSKNLIDKFRIKFAAGKDMSRPSFVSVLLKGNEFIASDTYRLAIKQTGFNNEHEGDILIPVSGVKLAEAIFDKKKDNDLICKISKDQEYISLFSAGSELILRLRQDKFPDFKKVIPEKFSYEVLINSKDAIEELSFLQEFNKKSVRKVAKMIFNNGNIHLKKNDDEKKQVKSDINIIEQSGKFESDYILLDHDFLIDSLKHNPDKEVKIKLNHNESPAVFEFEDGIDLVLPVKEERPF